MNKNFLKNSKNIKKYFKILKRIANFDKKYKNKYNKELKYALKNNKYFQKGGSVNNLISNSLSNSLYKIPLSKKYIKQQKKTNYNKYFINSLSKNISNFIIFEKINSINKNNSINVELNKLSKVYEEEYKFTDNPSYNQLIRRSLQIEFGIRLDKYYETPLGIKERTPPGLNIRDYYYPELNNLVDFLIKRNNYLHHRYTNKYELQKIVELVKELNDNPQINLLFLNMKDEESDNYISGLENIKNMLDLIELSKYEVLYNVLLNLPYINIEIEKIKKELIPLIEIRYIFEKEKTKLHNNKLNNISKLNSELEYQKRNASLENLIKYLNNYSNKICLGFSSKKPSGNYVNAKGCVCNITIPYNLLPPIEHTIEGQQIIFGNDKNSKDNLNCCNLSILNPFYTDNYKDNYLSQSRLVIKRIFQLYSLKSIIFPFKSFPDNKLLNKNIEEKIKSKELDIKDKKIIGRYCFKYDKYNKTYIYIYIGPKRYIDIFYYNNEGRIIFSKEESRLYLTDGLNREVPYGTIFPHFFDIDKSDFYLRRILGLKAYKHTYRGEQLKGILYSRLPIFKLQEYFESLQGKNLFVRNTTKLKIEDVKGEIGSGRVIINYKENDNVENTTSIFELLDDSKISKYYYTLDELSIFKKKQQQKIISRTLLNRFFNKYNTNNKSISDIVKGNIISTDEKLYKIGIDNIVLDTEDILKNLKLELNIIISAKLDEIQKLAYMNNKRKNKLFILLYGPSGSGKSSDYVKEIINLYTTNIYPIIIDNIINESLYYKNTSRKLFNNQKNILNNIKVKLNTNNINIKNNITKNMIKNFKLIHRCTRYIKPLININLDKLRNNIIKLLVNKSINIQYETTGSKKGIPFSLLPQDYEKILIMPFIKFKTIQKRGISRLYNNYNKNKGLMIGQTFEENSFNKSQYYFLKSIYKRNANIFKNIFLINNENNINQLNIRNNNRRLLNKKNNTNVYIFGTSNNNKNYKDIEKSFIVIEKLFNTHINLIYKNYTEINNLNYLNNNIYICVIFIIPKDLDINKIINFLTNKNFEELIIGYKIFKDLIYSKFSLINFIYI